MNQKIFSLTFLLLLFPLFVYSQTDLPSLKPLQQGLKAGWFSRMDGEFIVEIPVDNLGSKHEPKKDDGKGKFTSGRSYGWWAKGLSMFVDYSGLVKPPVTEEEQRAFIGPIIDGPIRQIDPEWEYFRDNYNPGKNCHWNGITSNIKDGKIFARWFIFKNRYYEVKALAESPEIEATAIRFMNSFRFVDAEKIAEMRIEAAMPEALPQTPAVKRVQSDAEELGLKGKVRVVYESGKTTSPDLEDQKLQPRFEMRFDIDGYFLSMIGYEFGQPGGIIVYGFLDGMRVKKSSYIPKDDVIFGIRATPSSAKPEPPRDKRYSERSEYKYDDQKRLIEQLDYSNNGTLKARTVITRNGDGVMEKRFDGEGKQIYESKETLDEKGRVIESTWRWLPGEGTTVVFEYASFDKTGNWTERTRSLKKIVDGKEAVTPLITEYRRIEYY